ncbi:hypothetical protein GGR21_002154 [Dysgonomonas hofstadii]|uniref:Lipocalin-like domain-containing protein n=1 Tax=Dysgonomonas hofstadii TaxID=637886 RepID=A0A840CWP1_9BACT|nr:hypothetical protein [Dysgonomonas hofstadii]MBB4036253.1 hypothetical protein [Dysgonomonas hofstadii]
MKNLHYVFLALLLSVGFISCSSSKQTHPANGLSNKSAIQGSWMIIEENGVPIDRKQIKHYTGKNFIWHTMDQSDIIRASCAGTYIIEGNNLYEIIEMTTPNYTEFKGTTAKIEITINNDTLFQNTVMSMYGRENRFTEKWVRMK